jgi:hypothetical protein
MAKVRQITEIEIKGTKVQKNINISKALFQIIFESIADAMGDRALITLPEVERLRVRLEEAWPHMESLFDSTCSACMETPWYVRDGRRKDALTRLVFARIIMNVHDRPAGRGANFPRVMVSGLQQNIETLLSGREWTILNEHARFIFNYIGSDDDAVIATQLKLNRAIQLLCQRVFLTLLLRFKNFNSRRQDFIRIVNKAAVDSGYQMSDIDFCEIFEALFRDYHDILQSDEGRARLMISHSEDYPEKMQGIFDAYFRFKAGLSGASRRVGVAWHQGRPAGGG